jgi:hypothetical protein
MRRAALIAALALLLVAPARGATFDTKTASFAVTFHNETSAYRDTTLVALPGAAIIIDAVGGPPGDYAATTDHGILVQQGVKQWKWTAPERPGTYVITVDGPGKKDAIAMHAFVMVPAGQVKHGFLNGYRMGEYPSAPLRGNPLYLPPAGFIEVTRENQDTKVSPHFTLKQFLCKEDTSKSFPKYLVLKERLPLKLEAVLERVNQIGFKVDTLHVMSAYRTPFYNHAIGDAKYSMHQFGGAADIYIDPMKNDHMEDLNHDGRIDIGDARFLYDEIERLLTQPEYKAFQGGMGYYPANSAHPPFVHVDVRGTAARWKG